VQALKKSLLIKSVVTPDSAIDGAGLSCLKRGGFLQMPQLLLRPSVFSVTAASSKSLLKLASRKATQLTAQYNPKHFHQLNRTMTTITVPNKQAAIFYEEKGGPEVLKYTTEFPVPSDISATEILVKNRYAGVNFIEVYFRLGVYPATYPYVPGREASGEIVAVGEKVKNFNVGDKIAYLGNANFCQYTKLDSNKPSIINLGKDATDEQLKLYAAALIQGLTALTFVHEAYAVKEGDYILVTAASGGVGLILDQLIGKIKKAHVIAVASTDEKLAKAKANGAEFLLNSTDLTYEQIGEKVLEITNGKGVDAIFDSIGKDTWEIDMKVVKRKGTIISFGNASGVVPPLSINRLSPKNIKIARPQLYGYITEPEEFQHYTKTLFDLISSGELNIDIFKVFPLKEYPVATTSMEGRKTTGKIVLEIPN
jgi:NADPH2:quinone reductase